MQKYIYIFQCRELSRSRTSAKHWQPITHSFSQEFGVKRHLSGCRLPSRFHSANANKSRFGDFLCTVFFSLSRTFCVWGLASSSWCQRQTTKPHSIVILGWWMQISLTIITRFDRMCARQHLTAPKRLFKFAVRYIIKLYVLWFDYLHSGTDEHTFLFGVFRLRRRRTFPQADQPNIYFVRKAHAAMIIK